MKRNQLWLAIGVLAIVPWSVGFPSGCSKNIHGVTPTITCTGDPSCNPLQPAVENVNSKAHLNAAKTSGVLALGATAWDAMELCFPTGSELAELEESRHQANPDVVFQNTAAPGPGVCYYDFTLLKTSVDLFMAQGNGAFDGRIGLIQLSPIFGIRRAVPPYLSGSLLSGTATMEAFEKFWIELVAFLNQYGGLWVFSLGNEVNMYLNYTLDTQTNELTARSDAAANFVWADYISFLEKAREVMRVPRGIQFLMSASTTYHRWCGLGDMRSVCDLSHKHIREMQTQVELLTYTYYLDRGLLESFNNDVPLPHAGDPDFQVFKDFMLETVLQDMNVMALETAPASENSASGVHTFTAIQEVGYGSDFVTGVRYGQDGIGPDGDFEEEQDYFMNTVFDAWQFGFVGHLPQAIRGLNVFALRDFTTGSGHDFVGIPCSASNDVCPELFGGGATCNGTNCEGIACANDAACPSPMVCCTGVGCPTVARCVWPSTCAMFSRFIGGETCLFDTECLGDEVCDTDHLCKKEIERSKICSIGLIDEDGTEKPANGTFETRAEELGADMLDPNVTLYPEVEIPPPIFP